jgi:hypothetical protein
MYQIGICTASNKSNDNVAIQQTENKQSIVLGRLDRVNLVGTGQYYD